MVGLTIVRATDGPDVSAVAQWDSSVHDSVYLNRITPGELGWGWGGGDGEVGGPSPGEGLGEARVWQGMGRLVRRSLLGYVHRILFSVDAYSFGFLLIICTHFSYLFRFARLQSTHE